MRCVNFRSNINDDVMEVNGPRFGETAHSECWVLSLIQLHSHSKITQKRKKYCGNVEAETPVLTVMLGPPKDPYDTNMLGPSSKWMCLNPSIKISKRTAKD